MLFSLGLSFLAFYSLTFSPQLSVLFFLEITEITDLLNMWCWWYNYYCSCFVVVATQEFKVLPFRADCDFFSFLERTLFAGLWHERHNELIFFSDKKYDRVGLCPNFVLFCFVVARGTSRIRPTSQLKVIRCFEAAQTLRIKCRQFRSLEELV